MMPSGSSACAEPGFLTSRLFIWCCCCCCWYSFAFAMVVGQHRTTLDRITSGTPAGSWDDSSLSKPEEATSSFDASSLIRFGAYQGSHRSEKAEEQWDGMLGPQDRTIRRDPSENDVQKILRETIPAKRPVNVTSSSSESPWKQADVQTVAGEEDARWMRTQDDDDDDDAKVKQLPQAIIIGVKKGGTRALLEFLRTHPDVRATGPEIHFFDKNYKKGLEWYRSHMPTTISGQITVEKTPSYWITKSAPSRIHNMSTTVRLIVVVRDPTTRALSDYTQAISKRPNLGSFEQMAFISNTTRMVDTSWGAIRIGVYCRHLAHWLEYFPLKRIHFVNGERLISDPAGELATVQDFLGLKRVVTQKHFYFNATKGFPCLKKSERSGVPHCLGKTKGRTHPAVDPYVLRRLREFYRPFNQKFYQMTGIDFGWP